MNKENFFKTPSKSPTPEVMARLARGVRPSITKKEMYELTNKNYKKLPEVREKSNMKDKREDFMKRRD